MARRIVIGSRGSKLALTQSRWVMAELARFHPGLQIGIVEIKTSGDRNLGASLSELGGKGAFTKELEDALLESRCDLAVHSLKDLPTTLPAGLKLACTPVREVTCDLLILRDPAREADRDNPLQSLPEGVVVGSSSLRRKAMLLATRPDLRVIEFRGNVDTRLRKLDAGEADASILAAAGLSRLGLLDDARFPARVQDRFDALPLLPPAWLPAVGQGALGIETRADDAELLALLAPMHDAGTFAAVAAERAFLNRLGAGCQAPVAALGVPSQGSTLSLMGRLLARDGSSAVEVTEQGVLSDPEELGRRVAELCLRDGAELL